MTFIPVLFYIMTNTTIIVLHRSHGTEVVLQAYKDALDMRRASVIAQYIVSFVNIITFRILMLQKNVAKKKMENLREGSPGFF